MKIDQLIDEILTIMDDADQEQLLTLGDELQDIGQLFHFLAEIVTNQIKQMEQ
ncbi:MAG: hypothetical protein HOH43_01070 [Candidatus Latescibacteria bacterium]|nr:hypothetical protein [Candidatus Latescibacterota bacterium]